MATVRAGGWLWVPAVRSSDILGGKRDEWTLGLVQQLLGHDLDRGNQTLHVVRALCLLRKGQGVLFPINIQVVLLMRCQMTG